MDLLAEMTGVAAALADAAVPFAIVGGVAMGFYVKARTTLDLDILIDETDLPRARAAIADLGFLPYGPEFLSGTGATRIRRFAKTAGADFLVLDCLMADDATRPALADPVRVEFRGVTLPVAARSVLVELKSRRASAQDRADIEMLREGHNA